MLILVGPTQADQTTYLYDIYGYTPSFALTVVATVLFTLFFIVQLYQVLRYRSWYFATTPIALLLEVVGYIARLLSAKQDPYNLTYFVLQYFFIVTAPVFLSASIYAMLSILVSRTGRKCSPLPPKAILGVFITCDCVSTVVQVTGAALIGIAYSNKKDPSTVNHILLGGLIFQVVTFFAFLVLIGIFYFRARKIISSILHIQTFLISFLAATLMVYLRTCFRLAETSQGLGNELSAHEVYFVCLEFSPIAVAMLLFSVWHPGGCLTKHSNTVRSF